VVDEWAEVARKSYRGECSHHFYTESGMMVQMPNTRLIYEDICRWMMEEINQHAMIKYLWGKTHHWTEVIFRFIDWKAVETCMTKMAKKSGYLVTNTLKLVHGWQNDGQQKEPFYEDGEDTLCPASCGQLESRIKIIQCSATNIQAGQIKRRGEFKKTHGKLRTVKVIYEGFMRIFISLRCGDAPPSNVTYAESDIDTCSKRHG